MKDMDVAVDTARDAGEVVHRIKEDGAKDLYQLVLIDWDMHDADGLQAAENIRSVIPSSVPILFMAESGTDGMDEALHMENTGMLSKPFFVSALKEKISERMAEKAGGHTAGAVEEGSLEGLYFLAAEDNEINAEILHEILTIEGAGCEIVENGQLAVERFMNSQEGEFDAILMDVQMPVMNGYDATRAIRKLERMDAVEIPIIAMTANAFAEDQKEAIKAGMNVHLAKPIDIELLKKVIKQYT